MIAPLAEIAPLAPEVPIAAVGLGVLAFYVVMFGLKNGYYHSLGALLHYLADELRHVRFVGGFLAGKLDAINHKVEQALASGLAGAETVVGKWWYFQKEIAQAAWDATTWLATSTLDGFTNLTESTIPHVTKIAVAPVVANVGDLKRTLRAEVARLENQLVRKANALARQLESDFGRAWRGIDHIQRVELRRLWRGVHSVEADVAGLEHAVGRVIPHRLSRLEKLLGAGAIGGAAIYAMTRVFPYWQCSNVKRFMRNVCRADAGLFDDLFGLALLFLGPLSIVDFARQLQGITGDVAAGVDYFVHE